MVITPAIGQIKARVEQQFEVAFRSGGTLRDLGVYNPRYIKGTTTWSQHAWGNAWDIGCTPFMGDQVVDFLRRYRNARSLPIGTILWRVAGHFDHIHVEGVPKPTSAPPHLQPKEDEMNLSKETWQAALDTETIEGDKQTGADWYVNRADQAAIDHGISEILRGLILRQGEDPSLPADLLRRGQSVRLT